MLKLVNFILTFSLILFAVVKNENQLKRLYSDLNISGDTINLSSGNQNSKITVYYKDHLSFYCSTVNRSVDNFDVLSDGSSLLLPDTNFENVEYDAEANSTEFEWFINDQPIYVNQKDLNIDYDSFLKSHHVNVLNVTCTVKIAYEQFEKSFEFPTIYLRKLKIHYIHNVYICSIIIIILDVPSINYIKNDFELMIKVKYQKLFKVTLIGISICSFFTLNIMLLKLWSKEFP